MQEQTPTKTEQLEQQQQQQMTAELASELVELLADPKIQVKYHSLNAILLHTKTDQAKILFLSTSLFAQLFTFLQVPQLNKVSLSLLINFSSVQECAQKLLSHLQELLAYLSKCQGGLPEELSLLLLLNLSKIQQFTNKIIKNKTQTMSPQVIFQFFNKKPSKKWVIANIFVNITSNDIGREYVGKNGLYLKFLQDVNDEKEALRLAVLRIVRNVAFLWENQQIISELLKKQHHVIDRVVIHILIMIIKSKLVQETQKAITLLKQTSYSQILDYDMQIQPDLPKLATTKQKSINQIEICIDILIILSNADFPNRKPQFLMQQLKQAISIINFTQVSEGSKDKLQALQTFCFW